MSANAPQRLSPLDVMFLYGERPDTMMHVASLMPFQPPPDAPPAFLRELVDEARRNPEVYSPWNRKLRYPGCWAARCSPGWWTGTSTSTTTCGARRWPARATSASWASWSRGCTASARSPPAAVGGAPDRGPGGRAVRGLHEDAPRARRRLQRRQADGALAVEGSRRSRAAAVLQRPAASRARRASPRTAASSSDLGSLTRSVAGQAGSALTLRGGSWSRWCAGARFPDLIDLPPAPRSILNHRIGRNRRFATQQYELEHLKRLGAAARRDAQRRVPGDRRRRAAAIPLRARRAAGSAARRLPAGQRAPQGRRGRWQRGRRHPRHAGHRHRRSRRAAAARSRRRRAARSSSWRG